MPSDLPGPERHLIPNPDLLNFLKGRDNPFDVFVSPRKPDAEVVRFHVRAVHQEVLDPLLAIIARYRTGRLCRESDLPRSGVVVILGARGTGKTHMVHVLRRTTEPLHVLVTPAIYDPHRPFIEYLLHQLVRHFQNESQERSPGTLDLLADALARRVVVQAFHAMSDIEWLGRNVQGPWNFFNPRFLSYFLGWGTFRLSDRKQFMILDLEQGGIPSILEACAQHEQDPADLRRLALQHIEQTETGQGISGQIRRGLYRRLLGRAFGDPAEDLYDFLLDGYTQVESRTQPARATLVDELFQALLELCLLARLPVVFAFDALETLLGDPPEPRLCHPFAKGLAEVLDSHAGIPFLLFAESGHWQKALALMSQYAQQRFQQGVIRVPKHGSISLLELPRVSGRQLGQIIAARVEPLLREFFQEDFDKLPIYYPFSEKDVLKISRKEGEEPPLRQALQALRDRYEELIDGPARPVGTASFPEGPQAVLSSPERLASLWELEKRDALRRLQAGQLNALADDLHAGLARWLECLIAQEIGLSNGRPVCVNNEILGEHPTYGQVTRVRWRAGENIRDLGLAFLLGAGAGMPRDLQTKVKMVSGPGGNLEKLVLLWPRGNNLTSPIQENFPPATREVWNRFEKQGGSGKVRLRGVALEALVPWLALPRWLHNLRAELEKVPPQLVNQFVAENCASLLPLVAPED